MKSKFFGLSAKLALAILAVGTTLTSCYDSENVDVVAPGTPVEAKYYISGNITDARTGEALVASVTITKNGATVAGPIQTSYINQEVEGDDVNPYVVTVDVDGYYTATRSILMPVIPDGGVSVGNADIALVSVLDDELLPNENGDDLTDVPFADRKQAEAALEMHGEQILGALTGSTGEIISQELIVDEYNNLRLVATATLSTADEGKDVKVTVPWYSGFNSTVPQSANDIFSKAITEGSIWNASAAAFLNRNYPMSVVMRTATLSGVDGAAINGYTLVVYFTNRVLEFGGYEGTVTYQGEWYVVPSYEGHDNHDLHNILHGNHNGAGGGNSNFGY